MYNFVMSRIYDFRNIYLNFFFLPPFVFFFLHNTYTYVTLIIFLKYSYTFTEARSP